jgi:predicted P-loop ATPase
MGTQGRKEAGHIKAMITRTADVARLSYAKTKTVLPRGFVFIGTDNNAQLFSDDTGNRRYWPVTVGDIDLAALRRDRDQLLAEALAVYNAEFEGVAARVVLDQLWWGGAGEVQASYAVQDPWADRVADILSDSAHMDSLARPCEHQGVNGLRINAFDMLARIGEARVTSNLGRRLKPLMALEGWDYTRDTKGRFYFKAA